MEYFDPVFIQQLAPLLTVNLPSTINSDVGHQLKLQLDQFNISNTVWDNSILRNRILSTKYIINYRNTDPGDFLTSISIHRPNGEIQHSILSPFNSESDIFPNGILTTKWLQKYLKELPFAFVSVMELPESESDDHALVNALLQLKNLLVKVSIKFTAIVVSNDHCSNTDSRIDSIRQLTDLPRITGLLSLHYLADNKLLQRDSEILVTSLISNLKSSATSFYSAIELRIKQRNKKYYTCPSTAAISTQITLTPNFLETRNLIKQAIITQLSNAHNLDTSLKLLEQAHELSVALLYEIVDILSSSKDISDHDANLYRQIRSLIDFIAFHIVRGYLSIEEPISALRKHLAHISNVADVIKAIHFAPVDNWLSIQYQWVGELLELVPESILAEFGLKAAKKRSKNIKCLEFFGGIFFLDSFQHDIITHPGLLFLKSAELIYLKSGKIGKLHYLDDYSLNFSSQLLCYQKFKLLQKSKLWIINLSSGDHEKHESYLIYINWLIAEVYAAEETPESMDKAVEYYTQALGGINPLLETSKRAYSWKNLIVLLSQKLLQIYEKKKDYEQSLLTIVNLSLVNDLASLSIKSDCFQNDPFSTELTNSQQLFDIEALLVNDNLKNSGTFAYDNIITQLKITLKANLTNLNGLINGATSVKLYIKDIDVEYMGTSNNVHFRHNEDSDPQFFQKDLSMSSDSECELNLLFYDDSINNLPPARIIQFSKSTNKPGILQITSIKFNSIIEIRQGSKVSTLLKSEIIDWNHQSSHYKLFYSPAVKAPSAYTDLVTTSVRTDDKLPVGIRVQSLKPDITVTMKSTTLKPVLIGEKVAIPFEITYQNPKQHKVYYDQLLISVKVKLVFDDQDSDDGVSGVTIRVNWDNLKDDESLSLRELVDSGGGDCLNHLNIRLNSSPQSRENEKFKSCRLLIDLKTVVHEEGEGIDTEENQMAIYDTASYTLPIINSPFETRFVVTPRYREENAIDMPNPFVLIGPAQDSHHEEHNKSLPIASRLWLGKLHYTDNLEVFSKKLGGGNGTEYENLEIVLHQFSIKTKNPGLIVESVESSADSSNSGSIITQLFTTRSKHGFSHRNISIVVSVQIKWKRTSGDAVNEYESKDWEIVLPLSDPRVLLSLTKDDAKEGSNYARFKYIIENPTPRIFTFTTHLSDEENDGSVLWEFNDDRNIVEVKQLAFPVLPFTRHVVEYYGNYTVSNDGIKSVRLPQFKVYDVNYRIWLPTLSVTDSVSVADTGLYWQRATIE